MKITIFFLILICSTSSHSQQHEWFPDNSPTGAEPILDPIRTLSGDQIAGRLKRLGGHYITGRYKIASWINQDGKHCSSKHWEVVRWDREEKAFVHAWRGQGDDRTIWIFEYHERIIGEIPKIQGEFFKENSH